MDPDALYKQCLAFVAKFPDRIGYDYMHTFPTPIVCDILQTECKLQLCLELEHQLSDLKLFERLLRFQGNWVLLHKCMQVITAEHAGFGRVLLNLKLLEYARLQEKLQTGYVDDESMALRLAAEGMRLGAFFAERGMFKFVHGAYQCVHLLDENCNVMDENLVMTSLELWLRLAHALTLDCKFAEADRALLAASLVLDFALESGIKVNRAYYFTVSSCYLFALSRYDQAHANALKAVQELTSQSSAKVIVDALKQACRTSITKRLFAQAHLYIKQALQIARCYFGPEHLKYAECLSDYGFYLISVDAVSSAVKIYQAALDIREEVLGRTCTVTAVNHEDLAYALYVRDYSAGSFGEANAHAELALDVLSRLLPKEHLMLASSKRVQALILEEVAVDSDDAEKESHLLTMAEELHLDSLRLSQKAFGEDNVQTAKHYGNLGRLYQSMKRLEEAESMHLKAIDIKERLLGPEDYEVALSLGHLASLYNYDMNRYADAEKLYLRSIAIGINLFGARYSGLEYDYRGLVYLFDKTGNYSQMAHYYAVLTDWKHARQCVPVHPVIDDFGLDVHDLDIHSVISVVQEAAIAQGS